MEADAKKAVREILREFYDKTAQAREASTMEEWKVQERAEFLNRLLSRGARWLLEIGAGVGRDSKYFYDHSLEVVCIDLSPEMVALCHEKGLQAYVMDMAEMDFPAASFDAVYSMNSLLHIPKSEFADVLRRVEAVLRPAGLFYLGMYGGIDQEGIWENDWNTPKRFFSNYTDEDLKRKVEQVFDVLSFKQIPLEPEDPFHFQSLTLRKRANRKE